MLQELVYKQLCLCHDHFWSHKLSLYQIQTVYSWLARELNYDEKKKTYPILRRCLLTQCTFLHTITSEMKSLGEKKKKETGFLHLRETLLSALCQVGMKVCEDAVPQQQGLSHKYPAVICPEFYFILSKMVFILPWSFDVLSIYDKRKSQNSKSAKHQYNLVLGGKCR